MKEFNAPFESIVPIRGKLFSDSLQRCRLIDTENNIHVPWIEYSFVAYHVAESGLFILELLFILQITQKINSTCIWLSSNDTIVFIWSCRGVVALCPAFPSLIPGSSSLSYETLSRGPVSIWSYLFVGHLTFNSHTIVSLQTPSYFIVAQNCSLHALWQYRWEIRDITGPEGWL